MRRPVLSIVVGRTGQLSSKPIRNIDICRMVKRRLRDASLPEHLSPHSFRVAAITDLLTQDVPLRTCSIWQATAIHERLYDRRHHQVTRNTVEKISI